MLWFCYRDNDQIEFVKQYSHVRPHQAAEVRNSIRKWYIGRGDAATRFMGVTL